MAKPTIVTRAGAGRALTHTEADANFTNLRDATITVTDGTTGSAIDLNGTVTFSGANGVTVSQSGGTLTIDGSNLILGSNAASGNINLNGNNLTDSTGGVNIDGTNTIIVSGTTGAPITAGVITGGTNTGIIIATNNGAGDAAIVVAANGIIDIAAGASQGGSGNLTINNLTFPNSDGTAGQVITTDGIGNLSFGTVSVPTNNNELTNGAGYITSTLAANLNVGSNTITYDANSLTGLSFETNGAVKLGYVQSYREIVYEETVTTSGTWAPNVNNGPIQFVSLTGNLTINELASVTGGESVSILIENSGGTYTLTLGANILQAGGNATTLTGLFDLLTITCIDDITPLYIAAIQSYS